MYLSAAFILQNFYKKNLRGDSELWRWVPFLGQNSPFVLNKKSFGINYCNYFHLPMVLFIVQNLKEILQWIQNYDHAPIFGPKVVHLPQIIFFFRNILIFFPFFICLYLRIRFFPSMQFSQDVNEPKELWFYINSRQN